MISYNGKVWSFNGAWGNIDPYNLLHLPPFTAQLRYRNGVTPSFPVGAVGVQVSDKPNLWNVTYENPDWSYLFHNSSSTDLLEIMGANTTGVVNMHGLCSTCSALEAVAIFDTSKVTDMGWMFNYCPRLTAVPLYDTSSATNMQSMFMNCHSLRTVPLYNTSKVTDMSAMFYAGGSEVSQLLADGCPLFDTSSVTTMANIFNYSKVPSIPQFNTANVSSMEGAFRGTSITSLPMLDTSNVTNMKEICVGCHNLTAIPNWDTSKVENWMRAFQNTSSMLTLPTHLDYSAATNVRAIAAYNTTKTGGILDLYNKLNAVSTIYDHTGAFYLCGSDTQTGAAELAQIPDDWKGEPLNE